MVYLELWLHNNYRNKARSLNTACCCTNDGLCKTLIVLLNWYHLYQPKRSAQTRMSHLPDVISKWQILVGRQCNRSVEACSNIIGLHVIMFEALPDIFELFIGYFLYWLFAIVYLVLWFVLAVWDLFVACSVMALFGGALFQTPVYCFNILSSWLSMLSCLPWLACVMVVINEWQIAPWL